MVPPCHEDDGADINLRTCLFQRSYARMDGSACIASPLGELSGLVHSADAAHHEASNQTSYSIIREHR